MRSILKTFLYILFLIIVVLVTLEIVIRLTGHFETYTERRGQRYESYYDGWHNGWYFTHSPSDTFIMDHGDFRYEYVTNSLGIREAEINWSDSDEIRLVAFGDSFTEGVGAPFDSTWPRELERQLRMDGYRASVFNAGISGSDPFYSIQFLKDKIIACGITHVVFSCNRSDIDDYLFRSGFERFRNNGTTVNRQSPVIEPLYKTSHLGRMFLENVCGYDKTLIHREELEERKLLAVEEINACLDSAMILCSLNNIKFMAIAHASPLVYCVDKPSGLDVRLFNGMQNEYPYIFIEDQLRETITKENCLEFGWENDGHFTGKGYVELGRVVFGEIQTNYPDFFEKKLN
jgi:hypothetical protein